MSTTKTSAQVPRLRFPGFEGEWSTEELADVFSISAGGDIDKERLSSVRTDDYRYPVFANAETEKGFYGYASYYKEEGGCITVSGRGNLGTPHARHERFVPIVRLLVLRPLNPADIVFFEKAISRINFFVESTGVPQLTGPQIGGYSVGYPTLPEQQKIAAFLTAVDGRIEQLSRKKTLLEATKKGVMQQLFTQTLRFQDDHGHDFPDWEEKTLGELTTWTSGGTPSKDEPSYWDGDIPWLSAASMHERYYDDSPLKISEEGLRIGSRIAKKGSLLLLVRGSMLWNRIPVGIATRDLAFNQDVKALALTKEVQAEFLLQWFIASENMLLHTVVGTGIGAGKLDTEEMKRLQVLLPSLPEQTKIAGFLSALDGKIAAVGEQIRQTQAWKKGLLQQMFV